MGSRAQGNLPSTTESNLRELKAITLRSGKELKSQTEAPKKVEGKEDDQYVMVEDVLKEEQASEDRAKESFKFHTFSLWTKNPISSEVEEAEG